MYGKTSEATNMATNNTPKGRDFDRHEKSVSPCRVDGRRRRRKKKLHHSSHIRLIRRPINKMDKKKRKE
jgi:hypothetical protein